MVSGLSNAPGTGPGTDANGIFRNSNEAFESRKASAFRRRIKSGHGFSRFDKFPRTEFIADVYVPCDLYPFLSDVYKCAKSIDS